MLKSIWFSDIFIFFPRKVREKCRFCIPGQEMHWSPCWAQCLCVRGPRRAEPGVSKVFLHSQDWCEKINLILICWRKNPAVEALLPVPCVWWFHGLSPCPTDPRRAHTASGSSLNSIYWPFLGQILGFSPPVLQLGQVLQGVPGHTSASLWRYKWWMETNPLYQNKHPK